jgi:hypothetical protein
MAPEAPLKRAHDRFANPRQRDLRPRGRADSVHHLIGLRIEKHFEKLLTGLRVVRQRSVGEAKSSVIIQTADVVENTAAVQ